MEELLLKKYMDYFTGIGFEIGTLWRQEYAVVRCSPTLFSIAKKELLTDDRRAFEDMSVHNPDITYEKVASMSCRQQAKGHHTMSFQEANVYLTSF